MPNAGYGQRVVLQMAGEVWRHALPGFCYAKPCRVIDPSMIAQTKALEDENRRLKKMFAEVSMQNELLKAALGKIDRPSVARKAIARICRGSTPRGGRECGGATWGKHCSGLPDLWGQRDVLSLWPEAACRERRDRRSAVGPEGHPQDLGVRSVFPAFAQREGASVDTVTRQCMFTCMRGHKRVYPLAGRRLPANAARRIYCALELNLRPLMV